MKPNKLISILLLILTIALAIYYFNKNFQDFNQLNIINPINIFYLVIIFTITPIILGYINKTLLKPLNINIGTIESYAISIINSFYNIITPFRGGIATRAYYLKRKYNLQYSKFLGLVATSTLLVILISSLLGLLSTLLIYQINGIFSSILFLIFLISFIISLLVIIISPKFKESNNNFINHFIRLINSWSTISKSTKYLFIGSFFTLIQLLLSSLAIQLQFGVFGIEIGYLKALFLASIIGLSLVISLTPANLGISEAITVFSALTIGITPVQSLSAAIMGRIVQFLVLLILGPIFTYYLIKRKV